MRIDIFMLYADNQKMISKDILDEAVRLNIRKELKNRQLSQNKLAEMAGLQPSNFSRSMQKSHGISQEFLLAVSKALGYDSEHKLLLIPEELKEVDANTRRTWNLLIDARTYNNEYFTTIMNLLADIKAVHEKSPEAAKSLCIELRHKSESLKELLKK